MANKYNNGKIYIIHNTKNDWKYIGSTTKQYLCERMSSHRTEGKKMKTQKLYNAMSELGVENFYIELLEPFPCESKEELEKREGELQRQYDTINNGYNHKVAGRTAKEYKQENNGKIKEYMKTYRENKKEELQLYSKEYYYSHKEECNKKYKDWYEEHKEHRQDYNKNYYHENKAKLKEKHYAKLKEYQAQRVKCDLCDKEMRRDNLSKHKKKIHSNNITI
jgi:hypothetical protein